MIHKKTHVKILFLSMVSVIATYYPELWPGLQGGHSSIHIIYDERTTKKTNSAKNLTYPLTQYLRELVVTL